MDIWRVQLKPDPETDISYMDVLDFCQREQIVGVGWCLIRTHDDDYDVLKREIESIPEYKGANGKSTAALKAVNAIRKMKPGDLVWTRLAEDASDYYLCRVGERLWTDRIVTEEHKRHDIGNFVSAEWVHVGNEDKVPGKVVNSFYARATAQHVYEVDLISQIIWNRCSSEKSLKYNVSNSSVKDFWEVIGSEELECLVMLYLQTKGYYILSSTLKRSTARYEAILVSNDGSHKGLPQVKRNSTLDASQYEDDAKDGDKVFLFTTSEDYGVSHPDGVYCITKAELEDFISKCDSILPDNIRYWVDFTRS